MLPQSDVNNAEDSQLWFWEHDFDDQFYLKSKAYPTKVLDLSCQVVSVRLWNFKDGGS